MFQRVVLALVIISFVSCQEKEGKVEEQEESQELLLEGCWEGKQIYSCEWDGNKYVLGNKIGTVQNDLLFKDDSVRRFSYPFFAENTEILVKRENKLQLPENRFGFQQDCEVIVRNDTLFKYYIFSALEYKEPYMNSCAIYVRANFNEDTLSDLFSTGVSISYLERVWTLAAKTVSYDSDAFWTEKFEADTLLRLNVEPYSIVDGNLVIDSVSYSIASLHEEGLILVPIDQPDFMLVYGPKKPNDE